MGPNGRFDYDDILRISCNNLSGYDLLKIRMRFGYADPCEKGSDFLCDMLNSLLSVSRGAGSISDALPAIVKRYLKRKKVGKRILLIIDSISSLEPYLQFGVDAWCEKTEQRRITNYDSQEKLKNGLREILEESEEETRELRKLIEGGEAKNEIGGVKTTTKAIGYTIP